MRASKTRVASKGIRVATDDGRSASSSADTQQQSATGMSSGLQGALATVVLLGTVVLLMGSSLRQVSQAAILDAASQATSVAASLPTDATSRKPGQVELLQRFRSLQAERGQAAPVATVELPPHVSTPSKPSCLITKWGAIWLMQISNSERSHVQHPIDGCESKALAVQDDHLDRFPKAYGGLGAYALDPASSRVACAARACTQQDLPRGAAAQPVAAVSQEDADEFASLHEPPNGWGMGPHTEWMERSSLRFNEAAKKAFTTLKLAPGQPLMLVFGGASVNEMLRNWAIHVQKLQVPYAVACMDENLFSLADDFGMPGVMMLEKNGAEKKVTTRWKYFRMDPKAFMTMGILKVRFFMEFMRGGFDVLCSDLDVIWLKDPTPWVTGEADPTTLLLNYPDVIVSTDVTHGGADSDAQLWGMGQEMNTGMLMLRSSPGGMAICQSWVERMQQEMVSIARLPAGMLQWWSNDQTFFNEVVHRATLMHTLKDPMPEGRTAAAEYMRGSTRTPARRAALASALEVLQALRQASRDSADRKQYRAVRGVLVKRIKRGGAAVPVSIATFPFLHFASGHTYFTQSLQDRGAPGVHDGSNRLEHGGFTPVAVHTTFQFGDTAEFAWGKRSRLREKLLWKVDAPHYFAFTGDYSPGKGATEEGYGGFIQLTGVEELNANLERELAPLIRPEASHAIKLEGMKSFLEASLAASGDVFRAMDRGSPNYHLIMDSYQRRLVHDALALGQATRRKVIMPKLWCWVDRYWNNIEGGRFPGVSAQQHPLPFHCPFDHLFDLDKWVHSDAPMREYSFLENALVTNAQRNDSVWLRVAGARDYTGGGVDSNARELVLQPGDNYAKVAAGLAAKEWQTAYVLKVDARSLAGLCEDIGTPAQNEQFNKVMHTVLGIAEQVRFCDAKVNPRYNGRQDDYRNPINCTWGFHRPPKMGAEGACLPSLQANRDLRNGEIKRDWKVGSREAWSTRDRAGYLYRNYM